MMAAARASRPSACAVRSVLPSGSSPGASALGEPVLRGAARVGAAVVGTGAGDGDGDGVIAGNRPAAFPALITELLAVLSVGSGIGGRGAWEGVGDGGVVFGAAGAATWSVWANTSGCGRGIAVVRAVAARVTVRTLFLTVSRAWSLVGVAVSAGRVHAAVLSPLGQPAVNVAA